MSHAIGLVSKSALAWMSPVLSCFKQRDLFIRRVLHDEHGHCWFHKFLGFIIIMGPLGVRAKWVMTMEKLLNALKLKKEAVLLDSKPFIVKTFLAITTAYILASYNEIASKDMISVLFGLILTLEPVNVTGLRRGWDQVFATLIGAGTTALIISVFGINAVSAGVSVSLTLYICLRVNWRDISPVALFTAIYMTQNIQMNALGHPSVLLTLRLRIIALGFGVFTAVAFNFIFSLIQYRKMGNRRIVFLMKSLLTEMNALEIAIRNGEAFNTVNCQNNLASIFNDIDSTSALFMDMLKENNHIRKWIGVTDDRMRAKNEIVRKLRVICHLLFDMQLLICEHPEVFGQANTRLTAANTLHEVMDYMGSLKEQAQYEKPLTYDLQGLDYSVEDDISMSARRIFDDLIEIHANLERVAHYIEQIA